jgi:putative membrane protein
MPVDLYSAWNADPVAIGAVLVLICLHRATQREGFAPLVVAACGLVVLFLSPLCALTVALFSARVFHHVLLVAVVAPLVAMAFPVVSRTRIPLGWLVGSHAVLLWFWHVPGVYEAAVGTAPLYWAMQATLLGSAVLLWGRIFAPGTGAGQALLALLATAVQMGMLGALLTFARSPLYTIHLTTTLPFGLTPLQDQQLAGLIMWVPAMLPYLAAAVFLSARRLAWVAHSSRPARP